MGFRIAFRVGRARRPATDVPDEWPSIARKGGDRTRLTGRLTLYIINGRPPLKLQMHDELLIQAFPKLSHASPNCRQIELYKNINRTHCEIKGEKNSLKHKTWYLEVNTTRFFDYCGEHVLLLFICLIDYLLALTLHFIP